MPDEKGYNGWSNYETWAVKLWIDNEEGDYNYWREETRMAWRQSMAKHGLTRKDNAASLLSEMLKSEYQENTPTVNGVYADLLNAALGEVDWYEIATAMITDEELTDDDEEESA